jgi:hypothetical protein
LPQAATRVPVRRRSGTRWWRSGRRWGTSAVELSGRRRLGHGGIVWWLGGGGGTRGPPRPTGGLASGGGEDVAGTPSGGGTPDATREPRGGRRVSGKRQLACNTKCTTSPSKLNVAKVLTTGVAGQLSALAGGEEHVFHGLNVIPYDVEASLLASLPPSDHPCFSCSGGAVGAMPPSMAAAAAVDVVPRGPNPNSTGGELAARQPSLPPSPPDDVIPSDTDVDALCSRLPPPPVAARGPSPLTAPATAPTAPRPRPRRSPSPTPLRPRPRPRPRMQTRRAAGAAAPLSILALTWRPRCEHARCILLLRAAPRSLRSHTRAAAPRLHLRAARGRQPPVLGVRAPVQRSSSSSSSASSAGFGTTVTIVVVVMTAEDCAAGWRWGTDAGPAGATTIAAATCTPHEGAPRGCCGEGGEEAREEGVIRGVDKLGLERETFFNSQVM